MNGILNVYKEKGFTSHDVVAKLRGILHFKKIGHTGTLDPDAVGVLPVCIGKATKLVDLLTDKEKTYVAKVQLGVTTDTLDMSGQILSQKPVEVTKDQVLKSLAKFRGDIDQVPPMYSALKVNGKRLYDLARQGREVERKPRPVTIHKLEILDFQGEVFTMEVTCSKGTYIRSLCDDIGRDLGCGAAMAELERTQVGTFNRAQALTLDQIQAAADQGRIQEIMTSIDAMFPDAPKLKVTGGELKLLVNGNDLPLKLVTEEFEDGSRLRVYDGEGEFYSLYRVDRKKKRLKLEKMFH
ncbi:MAG: tRNA pseudouridine(55) synthase TruB [Eubacterium sp.]|nr:tRNA pseudouridine(55) synthase TruB [Eubacterium sp.]